MSIQPVSVGPPPTPASQAPQVAGSTNPPPAATVDPGVSVVAAAGNPAHGTRINPGRIAGAGSATSDGLVAGGARVQSSERATESDREALRTSVERAKEAVETQVRDIAFSVDDRTGDLVVRIIDRASQEVIRQIPAEEMLRIAERLQQAAGGTEPGLLLKQEV